MMMKSLSMTRTSWAIGNGKVIKNGAQEDYYSPQMVKSSYGITESDLLMTLAHLHIQKDTGDISGLTMRERYIYKIVQKILPPIPMNHIMLSRA